MNVFRNFSRSRLLFSASNSYSRTYSSHSISADSKTQVKILNNDPEFGLMINSYSHYGFRLNTGMFVLGPMAIFPKSVLGWNVKDHMDIDEDSLSLFVTLEPKLDVLIIGCGDSGNAISPKLYKYLRSKKIAIEMLSTEDACATFNFLNAEKRYVAAAILPPKNVKIPHDDLIKQAFGIVEKERGIDWSGMSSKVLDEKDDEQVAYEIPKGALRKALKDKLEDMKNKQDKPD